MATVTNTLILDTSIVIKWLFKEEEEATEKARQLLLEINSGKYIAYAPEIQKYELANVLHKGKKIEQDSLNTYIEFIDLFPINYIQETSDIRKITHHLCFMHAISYYDASYIALTKFLNGTFITADNKLTNTVPKQAYIHHILTFQ